MELGAVQRLPVGSSGAARAERIAKGAELIQGEFHILFVHADGGSDPARIRRDNVMPGLELVRQRLGQDGRRGIAVVPVRETEAWALADADAVRATLGTARSARELGLPVSPAELERLLDPKATFAAVLKRARPGRRGRRRPSPIPFLDLLGERTSIVAVSRLAAFRLLLEDLQQALEDLGYTGLVGR
ncbi:MAG: hypothetical protein ACYCX7_05700 [Solirubrobacteraceae bacterium]